MKGIYDRAACQLPRASVTRHHKLGDVKQQHCILLQFCRLDIWIQGIARAMLPQKHLAVGASLLSSADDSRACSLAHGSITPVSASKFTWLSLGLPLLIRTQDSGLESILTSF